MDITGQVQQALKGAGAQEVKEEIEETVPSPLEGKKADVKI